MNKTYSKFSYDKFVKFFWNKYIQKSESISIQQKEYDIKNINQIK